MKKTIAATPAASQEIDWTCIFRMEEAISRVWAITDMVMDRCIKEIESSGNENTQAIASGLKLLENESFTDLESAFDQVTAYCRNLRGVGVVKN